MTILSVTRRIETFTTALWQASSRRARAAAERKVGITATQLPLADELLRRAAGTGEGGNNFLVVLAKADLRFRRPSKQRGTIHLAKSERPCRFAGVLKREKTHQRLLRHGLELVSRDGFAGATIGELADRAQLPKSGVLAYFGSSEALQLELERAAAKLARREVVEPALQAPPGLPRLRRLFERWLGWAPRSGLPGGCPFVTATAEFDDAEGAVRDHLVETLEGLIGVFEQTIGEAVARKELDPEVDAKALAWQLFGLYSAHHTMQRLRHDRGADAVALQGFSSGPRGSRRRERLSCGDDRPTARSRVVWSQQPSFIELYSIQRFPKGRHAVRRTADATTRGPQPDELGRAHTYRPALHHSEFVIQGARPAEVQRCHVLPHPSHLAAVAAPTVECPLHNETPLSKGAPSRLANPKARACPGARQEPGRHDALRPTVPS